MADIGTSIGAGLCLAAACGLRLKQANDRLYANKDMLTARAAREAAARIATNGVGLAMNGAALVQDLARSAADQAMGFATRLRHGGQKERE